MGPMEPMGPVAPSLVELRGREASSLKRRRLDSDSGDSILRGGQVVLTFEFLWSFGNWPNLWNLEGLETEHI